ncbi:MAG: aspartate carbamoyltransferase catalytic subunit [Bradymonadaceae bacterium]|nr:aspartate carbamoyltransferase catalytic subunit [Lujinxingiaceae bacterium]
MHLIGLEHMNATELSGYLDFAEEFLDERGRVCTPGRWRQSLADVSVALLFLEPSTRTRVSFELAAQRLGASSVYLSADGTSLEKGESVLDTCRNLEAMGVGAFIVRHNQRELAHQLTRELETPIINAGNGSGEHPTQGMLDALTLRRHFGSLQGLKVSIVGDVVHSRVARSDAYALTKLGAEVTLAGPAMLLPAGKNWGEKRRVYNLDEALEGADAVIVLRIQRERFVGEVVEVDAYIRDWSIDEEVVARAMTPNAVIMHPGPVMRGVELQDTIADGPRSLILHQVANGVAIRQAILARLLVR